MNSNIHPAAYSYSNKGKEQLETRNLFNSFRSSDHGVDLPEPTAISKNVPKTQDGLLSTAPPLYFADDPEIPICPSNCSKFSLT